jgi:hypothetical protein
MKGTLLLSPITDSNLAGGRKFHSESGGPGGGGGLARRGGGEGGGGLGRRGQGGGPKTTGRGDTTTHLSGEMHRNIQMFLRLHSRISDASWHIFSAKFTEVYLYIYKDKAATICGRSPAAASVQRV